MFRCRRLKPGGGGVNAAIFTAAGPALETATKEQAKSLLPGSAVVVPLPSTSPLFSQERVTHVIHVLGPNMNPQRPNCLDNDYVKGSKILCDAYTSLFEGFVSIIRKLPEGRRNNHESKQSEIQGHPGNATKHSEQKVKRDGVHESDRTKKYKGSYSETGGNISESSAGRINPSTEKFDGSTTKTWGSWAQALYNIAKQPEKHKDAVLEITDDIVVLDDLYPKVNLTLKFFPSTLLIIMLITNIGLLQAQKHILVLARHEGLDCIADVHKEHLQLLRTMHAVGLKWAEKFIGEDASLIFRLGYHSVCFNILLESSFLLFLLFLIFVFTSTF